MTDAELADCRAMLDEKYPESLTRMKHQRIAGLALLAEVERLRDELRQLAPFAELGRSAVVFAEDTNDCFFCNPVIDAEDDSRVRHDDECPVGPLLGKTAVKGTT